jgi:outer membrane protease
VCSIKRSGILVILTLFLSAYASAEINQKSLSVSPLAGILYGQSEEIVYKNSSSNLYLSELLWDLKPLFYIGVAADFGPKDPFRQHGFFASASLKYGLPFRTGIMEDRDWMNYSFDYVTHYSRHDAYSRGGFLSDVSAGYSWRLSDFLALKVFGEFTYMRFSWSARDGYVQYPSNDTSGKYPEWNGNIPKKHVFGLGITYIQNWFIISPGLSLTAKINRLFSFDGNLNYSPLIYCYDKDEHHLRELIFYDYCYYGHFIRGKAAFTCSLAKNMDLSLSAAYAYITGTRGNVQEGNSVIQNCAGTGYSALDLGLAAKFYVFGRD